MDTQFTKVSPFQITDNVFKLLDKDWMLVTAGTPEHFNTMTASWGGLGILWNKPVAFVFIRPTRYTYEFAERESTITLSFFTEKYRKALSLCGTLSGRDIDKVRQAGLTPNVSDLGGVYFSEARMIFECSKMYYADIDPTHFQNPDIDRHYPAKDYHRMYISEIINCYEKK
jgi:flavin reductase (DIM6/NTAB) family NADH-FMN oxidoreductase RutF